jgi:hypothetical protein
MSLRNWSAHACLTKLQGSNALCKQNVSRISGRAPPGRRCPDEKQGRFVLYRLHPDVFQATKTSRTEDYLNFGCCRIEIPKR